MPRYQWTASVNKRGNPMWTGISPELECYIQMSTFKRGYTSTTFWLPEQRFTSDRYLKGEQFRSFDEAKAWIESQDPMWIYNNLCQPKKK